MREAFASPARMAQARPDCPEPEGLWRGATGELRVTEIRDLIDHIAGCPSCAEDWRLAHEMSPRRETPVTGFPARRSQPRFTWWLAAAAVLLVFVSTPLWWDTVPVDSTDAVRAPGGSAAIQSLLAADVVLPRSNCILRWSAGPAPVGVYNLLVSTESFDVLVREEGLEAPTYRVPPNALERVPPGGKILWQIEVIGTADDRLVSPTFVQRLE